MTVRDREEVAEQPNDVKRTRPGVRNFADHSGPLSFLHKLKIPGYRLYFASDRLGNDPFYIQKLLDPVVGYEFVHPSEVGITEIRGVMMTDKVCMPVGGGAVGYLLKQPIEWAEEDLRLKKENNQKGIWANKNKLTSDPSIEGSIGSKNTFNIENVRKK